MIKVYEILWKLALPFVHVYAQWRIKHKKEDPDRLNERWGETSISRPSGTVIWVHAASVGESLSALTFIKRLKPFLSDESTFVITTNTVSSADLIANAGLDGAIHQYVPWDHKPYVKKFFRHWKPKYAFVMESELWPTLINECSAEHIFLINARLSDRSFHRWKYLKCVMSGILQHFAMIMAQTSEDANRYSYFSPGNVVYTGNIKYSTPPLKTSPALLDDLSKIRRKYVFVAASTHEGEDEIVLNAYSDICEKLGRDKVFLVLIPRHPVRAQKVCELAEHRGYEVCIRSVSVNKPCDVLCVDTFGEMGSFFSIADFVFVGGSLVRVGGHNIFEPILFQKPVMFGPNMFNFREMKDLMLGKGVGFSVINHSDMAVTFCRYIQDDDFRETISKNLSEIQNMDPMQDVITNLRQFIPLRDVCL